MFLRRYSCRVAASLLFLLGVSLGARHAAGQESKVAPKAQAVLTAFGKYFSNLKGYQVNVNIALDIEQMGKSQKQEFTQHFAVQKPNQFSYVLDSPQGGASILSDGKDLTVMINSFNKFAVEPAPENFEALFQNPIVLGSIGFGNAGGAMVAMMSDDPAESLTSNTQSIEYSGTEEIDGFECHVLKATQEQFDWTIWIDAGKQPLVRKFVPDLQKAFARMAKPGEKSPYDDLKIINTVTYLDWKLDPEFAGDAFAFQKPEDATQAGSLMELVTGRARQEPAPHVLLGKAAPAIELELLGGGRLNLASMKGEKIVILDFWATWCGPCVQAMPIIEKVAEKFKGKGVELYAVNLQEGEDEINAFLKDAKLGEIAIALDRNGKTAGDYLAEAIPQTVLIGKDGTVQVVKIGLSPTLEADLTKDLQALIDGKDLASETLAAHEKKLKERAERQKADQDDEQ